jgi:uncharacterized protein YaiE (UPF0345 family)
MASYFAYNGPMVTTASYAPVATAAVSGTAKTMLQIVAPATGPGITVWKWGLDFDGTGTNPLRCELIDTFAVAATVTAHVAAGLQPLDGSQSASRVQVGSTTLSGYTATAEGTITQTRYGSINSVLPGNGDRNEWSLGREFFIPAAHVLRIRVTPSEATARNCACYVCWDE